MTGKGTASGSYINRETQFRITPGTRLETARECSLTTESPDPVPPGQHPGFRAWSGKIDLACFSGFRGRRHSPMHTWLEAAPRVHPQIVGVAGRNDDR